MQPGFTCICLHMAQLQSTGHIQPTESHLASSLDEQSGVSLGSARCLGSLAPCPVQETLAHCSTASAGVSRGM